MFNNVFYLLAFLPLLYKYWKPILLNINNIYFIQGINIITICIKRLTK